LQRNHAVIALSLALVCQSIWAAPASVLILRHGEKDAQDQHNHNLNQAGFERSLRLPDFILQRYGQPDFIIAPEPRAPKAANIRAIQTITPLAIRTGVNIDTTWHVGQETLLASSVLHDPRFTGKTVLICWEHKAIGRITQALGAPGEIPRWRGTDYDSVYLLTFHSEQPTLHIEHQ
jgi:hypothetical protein